MTATYDRGVLMYLADGTYRELSDLKLDDKDRLLAVSNDSEPRVLYSRLEAAGRHVESQVLYVSGERALDTIGELRTLPMAPFGCAAADPASAWWLLSLLLAAGRRRRG